LSPRFACTAVAALCALSAVAGQAGEFTVPMISKGVRSRPIQMRFVGSNPCPLVEQIVEYSGISEKNVPEDGPRAARRTIYRQVYEGVDLMTYNRRGSVQYDLIVAPGANPEVIRIVYEGFENVELYAELPAYQLISGTKTVVPVVMEKTPEAYYRFSVSTYDPSRELVIPTTSVPITARARSYAQAP